MLLKLFRILLGVVSSGRGVFTSEFWITVGAIGLSGVVTLGVMPFDSMTALLGALAGLLANAAVVIAYVHGRTKVKTAQTGAGHLTEILDKVLNTTKE